MNRATDDGSPRAPSQPVAAASYRGGHQLAQLRWLGHRYLRGKSAGTNGRSRADPARRLRAIDAATPDDPYLQLERWAVTNRTVAAQGFAVLTTTTGGGHVHRATLTRASTAVVPRAAGPLELTSEEEVLIARPPRA